MPAYGGGKVRYALLLAAALVLAAGEVQAEEVVCSGSISSVQGEGLVARTHRFELHDVSGSDLMAVLEKCKKIAQERQNRAARKNPGGAFRKFSDLELNCKKGGENFQVRRSIQTAP